MDAEINIEKMGLMADLRDDSTYEEDVNTQLAVLKKNLIPVTVDSMSFKNASTQNSSNSVNTF